MRNHLVGSAFGTPEDDLRRSAADVDHGDVAPAMPVRGAEERKLRFAFAGDDAQRDADAFEARREIGGVLGVAACARGDGHHPIDRDALFSAGVDSPTVLRDSADRAIDRLCGQAARGIDALAEVGDDAHAFDGTNAGCIHIGDEEPARDRPDIDGCDSHACSSVLLRDGGHAAPYEPDDGEGASVSDAPSSGPYG